MITSLQSQALKLGLAEEEAEDYIKQVLIVLVGGKFTVRIYAS